MCLHSGYIYIYSGCLGLECDINTLVVLSVLGVRLFASESSALVVIRS